MVTGKRGKLHRIAAVLVAVFLCAVSAACEASAAEDCPYITDAVIGIGGMYDFYMDGVPSGEADWSSSNESVAAVSEGKVVGISVGEAVITSIVGTVMRTSRVRVHGGLLGVKSTSSNANLCVGDEFSLFAEGSDWTSSEETVAEVEEGVVRAVGVGVATIGCTYRGKEKEYTVTVMLKEGGESDETPGPDTPSAPASPTENRVLVWSDEFDGDALDDANWEYQNGVRDFYENGAADPYGPWFWGNEELQYYTKEAVSLADGICTITARRQSGLADGRQFTSARITTRDRGTWTYGYFEARMKLPLGTGMWPAFWMLPQPEAGMGTNNRYGGWAANGEIDIMEAKGRLPYEVGNTLHFGGNPSTFSPHTEKLKSPISEWHTYGFEWRSDHLSWYVDGTESYRMTNSMWKTSSPLGKDNPSAPFDVPFYLLINLAVGGNYDGGRAPDADFVSGEMQIDYVRVYS